jgi:hydroxymethylbilane synthase
MTLIVGTRGSKLALAQTNHVIGLLRKRNPGAGFETRVIKTTGDKIRDSPLAKIGGKGIFVKEIDEAVARGKVDFAVHSMKDVPTELMEDLEIVSVPRREDPRDVLISRGNASFDELPEKAVIGTSSLRRRAEALHNRGDILVKDIRGNVDTRLRKLSEGDYDALIMAKAGLKRLGFEEVISQELPLEEFLPAVGQGAIALVALRDSAHRELLRSINHEESMRRIHAERAFLKRLGGGCQVPMGVYTKVGQGMRMKAAVFTPGGEKKIEAEVTGKSREYEKTGIKCAEALLSRGAREILVKFL